MSGNNTVIFCLTHILSHFKKEQISLLKDRERWLDEKDVEGNPLLISAGRPRTESDWYYDDRLEAVSQKVSMLEAVLRDLHTISSTRGEADYWSARMKRDYNMK